MMLQYGNSSRAFTLSQVMVSRKEIFGLLTQSAKQSTAVRIRRLVDGTKFADETVFHITISAEMSASWLYGQTTHFAAFNLSSLPVTMNTGSVQWAPLPILVRAS